MTELPELRRLKSAVEKTVAALRNICPSPDCDWQVCREADELVAALAAVPLAELERVVALCRKIDASVTIEEREGEISVRIDSYPRSVGETLMELRQSLASLDAREKLEGKEDV